jgi:chemotaxis protein MotA
MMTFVGMIFGIVCIFLGYLLHGGSMMVFVNAWTEFISILGGAVGIFLASSGMKIVKQSVGAITHLLHPDVAKKDYLELLTCLYQLFNVARRDGLLGIEEHLEHPHKSSILGTNKLFLHGHSASFLCDTMKVIVSGGVKPIDLADMMEMDLESHKEEGHLVPNALQFTGDALPAVGICACVLGVIITMGQIGGSPAALGAAIGLALCGTFLGIFAAYLLFFPLVKAIEIKHRGESQYLNCIRFAVFSFARGESPITCVEFARRNIDPSNRPGFSEMEKAVKGKKG